MKRKQLWGMIIAAAFVIGLGAWLLGRGGEQLDADDSAATTRDAAERGTSDRPAPRRASARPDLTLAPKAAIAGTVRDPEGNPIAKAQVCVWLSSAELDGLPPGVPRCATSEADGHYRLEGLLPIRVTVNAQARGFLSQEWFAHRETHRETQLQLIANQTRERVDFVLRPGGVEVAGVVRDISGGVIEGAFVWSSSGGMEEMGRSAAVTDGEGRFTLWSEAGRITIAAQADGYANNERYTAAPGPTTEIFLTPESVIAGRVVMAGTGEPVSGVAIQATSEAFGGGALSARSDDAGAFRIAKLEPGIYTLGARGDELYGEGPELVHLGLAETAEGLVIELHPAFMVSGQITLAAGAGGQARPCAQGWVRLKDRSDKRNSIFARAHTDGEIELRSVLPGTYEVEVGCDSMVPEPEYPEVVITKANATGLVWEVREGLTIAGVIVDALGSPVVGVNVFASMQPDPNDPRKQFTRGYSDPSANDGSFRATGLLPGTYQAWVFGTDRSVESDKVEVVLEPGVDVNDVRIELPGVGTITGVVQDADGQPVANVTIGARPTERRSNAAGVSQDDGRFTIEHVPPGAVRVLAMGGTTMFRAPGTSDDDEQGTLVQVEAGQTTEVTIVVESRKAVIRGQVLDEQGSPVADAFISHQRMSDSAKANEGRGKSQLRWGFGSQPVLTDPDGRFVIGDLTEDATYVVGAFRKGGGEAVEDTIAPGDDVVLTIVETGEIAGVVVVGKGGPAPERFKLTLRNEAEGLSRNDELFRSAGKFRMKELPPGTYVLVVDSPAGAARVEGIELATGEIKEELVVSLSPRVTVRGRVIDLDSREPIAGMSVTIGPRGTSMSFGGEDRGDRPHISDAQGRFEVAEALTGKVMLAVMPRSMGADNPYTWLWLPFLIPEADEVVEIGDIELIANRTKRDQTPGDIGFAIKDAALGAEPEAFVATIALVRPGGPAEGSGLVVGDQINTVNGHDVSGTNSFRFGRLTKVLPGDAFELGLADGRTVTITAGPPIK